MQTICTGNRMNASQFRHDRFLIITQAVRRTIDVGSFLSRMLTDCFFFRCGITHSLTESLFLSPAFSRNALFLVYFIPVFSKPKLVLFMIYSRKLRRRFSSSSCPCPYYSICWVYFSFSRPCLPNVQPGLCSFLFFAFSLSSSAMFWFDKTHRLSAIIFDLVIKFDASPAFPWQLFYCTV